MNADAHPKRPHKIAIVGAGNIGKELWKELTERGAADEIVVQNRSNVWDNEQFKATMIAVDQANLIRHEHKQTSQFKFTNSLTEALDGADIVIVTAGVARKNPKQPRSELLELNCEVIDPIARTARAVAPNANYIIATNPVDTMTQRFQEESGIAANQIMGLGGELDRARMVQSICNQLKVPPEYVHNAHVIGQHGEGMMPVLSHVEIRKPGEAPQKLLDILADQPDKLREIRDAAIKGGARLVERLKTSDHIAPAAALEVMVNTIIDAKWRGMKTAPLTASTLSEKDGVFIGQPVQVGSDGTHKVLPLPKLSYPEQEDWDKSVKACHSALADIPGRKSALKIA
jgi:malate dehydrogenase